MRIAHETPGRLRLRLAADAAFLARVGGAVRVLPGVTAVRVNAHGGSVIVSHDGRPGLRARILATAEHPPVSAEGFVPPAGADGLDLAAAALAVGGAFALPRPLAAAVTFANVARPILTGAHAALTEGLKVEVLDAIAMGLPALRGEYGTANFTRFLMELATYIEAGTAERSDELLRTLLHRRPDDVWVDRDGQTLRVPFASLQGGERVCVGTGETVPVDGVVLSGAAYVDQSAVTGESLPQSRMVGDIVLSGGIVTDGRLVIRADRVGDATTTGRITRYIQEALERPAEIETVSEQLADKRIGITLASAAAVFALTRNWRRMESVFMVDYSCTVKLGTPIAIKSAMYRAAKRGCLIKSGQALEALAGVDTVVFDKTGTLTHNTLQVTDVLPLAEGLDAARAVATVAALGEHTTHPIARAVVDLAQAQGLDHVAHEEVDFIVGQGVEGKVGNAQIRFGSRHYIEDVAQVSFADERATVARLKAEGKSMLYAASNGTPFALFALRDRLRTEAAPTLARLRAMGVKRLVMITGDAREKAQAFGATLGLDEVHAEQQPEDKARLIAGLQAQGAKVAYVGDGVNDGPALMAADVGLAMPRAADIARATADVLLVEDRLDALADVLAIAQDTMALIRSNFRVAVAVNSAILACAATGRLAPATTALLHNGSTIGVLLRSLAHGRGALT